eukprot:CAMPEP_0169281064 /NCGR_PEP_ID=MMETSP1016-20121227/56008_1 /TAXON_ID=342587 /ORGANISM="Karlodinium micrum, Strain CCMP2283" /LENGTH=106 /DNA_ID=CAMNT_0009369565 /DNA_START=19 /DNA_END=339 /DNA_ORIENTATION=+
MSTKQYSEQKLLTRVCAIPTKPSEGDLDGVLDEEFLESVELVLSITPSVKSTPTTPSVTAKHLTEAAPPIKYKSWHCGPNCGPHCCGSMTEEILWQYRDVDCKQQF